MRSRDYVLLGAVLFGPAGALAQPAMLRVGNMVTPACTLRVTATPEVSGFPVDIPAGATTARFAVDQRQVTLDAVVLEGDGKASTKVPLPAGSARTTLFAGTSPNLTSTTLDDGVAKDGAPPKTKRAGQPQPPSVRVVHLAALEEGALYVTPPGQVYKDPSLGGSPHTRNVKRNEASSFVDVSSGVHDLVFLEAVSKGEYLAPAYQANVPLTDNNAYTILLTSGPNGPENALSILVDRQP